MGGVSTKRMIGAAAIIAALSVTDNAWSQPVSGDFTVQRFNPAPGPRNFITTRGARVDGKMAWSAGLFFNYARDPFLLRSCASETDCDNENPLAPEDVHVVQSMLTWDALASFTPFPLLQLGLKIPIVSVSGEGLTREDEPGLPAGSPDPEKLSAVGIGDVELEGKFRLAGDPNSPLVPGVALFATGPLGTASAENHYIGDRTPTVGLRGIIDFATGPVSVGANLAGVYRGESNVGSTTVGSELRYGVAGGFMIVPGFRGVIDAFGAADFRSGNPMQALEADIAAQVLKPILPVAVTAGAGFPILNDIGVPQYRIFLGLMFAMGDPADAKAAGAAAGTGEAPEHDKDDDMVADASDKCPTEAEDPDGFEDTDGCPEKDNDKDGIPDDADKCKDEPETKNGTDDEDGCADAPDRDRDGIPDDRDTCRKDPEDTDGFADEDGCPDPDNDKDGVADHKDECPDQPENKNNYQDDDGCPDPGN